MTKNAMIDNIIERFGFECFETIAFTMLTERYGLEEDGTLKKIYDALINHANNQAGFGEDDEDEEW